MNELYNEILKEAYLNSYEGLESTKTTIYHEFKKSSKVEKQYDKDLYAFNNNEIEDLLYTLKCDNIISISRTLSIFKQYVNWCIINGQRGIYENGENRIEVFQRTEDVSKYVSNKKVKNKYLSKWEFQDLVNILVNPVDQALLYCLYEFIGGEKVAEIRNLKIGDIDEDNRLVTLIGNNGQKRVQKISLKLIELLKETNETMEYISNNGIEGDSKKGYINPLNPISDYIFRVLSRRDNKNEPVAYFAIINKINNIKKYTGYDFITTNSIRETRIMHEIADKMEEDGLIVADDDVFMYVAEKIKQDYGIELSHMQIYSLKQKFTHASSLKDF